MSLLFRLTPFAFLSLALSVPPCHADFPFSIDGSRFTLDGQEVFLNILSYQPLEPGQDISGEIRLQRVTEDLRRWCVLQNGSDPVVVRVYAQPTAAFPVRMPREFYDGVRDLEFWIIRDIFFDENYLAPDAVDRGKDAIDAVFSEVEAVGAFDRIIAWEIGNEFSQIPPNSAPRIAALESFLCEMIAYVKQKVSELNVRGAAVSDWVTWNAYPPTDPLRTDGLPVEPACAGSGFDFFSINAYSYEPFRIRDHQGGLATGTPYAGYLAALKERISDRPVVVSETGLPDSPITALAHQRFKSYYPSYRKGGLSSHQAAEAVADRYWDARLVGIGGLSLFEYSDEWHKQGTPSVQENDHTEEHFGLIGYSASTLEAESKPHFQTAADVFRRDFSVDPPLITGLSAEETVIGCTGSTTLDVEGAQPDLRYRWESSRGVLIGDLSTVELRAAGKALGPATVTVIASDEAGASTSASIVIEIEPCGDGPALQALTLGQGPNSQAVASGQVSDVDLDQLKIISYIATDMLYLQPYLDMKSIWVRSDGYFWTPVDNQFTPSTLHFWIVPKSFDPPATESLGWMPPGHVGAAELAGNNDLDNDLLPDDWEVTELGNADDYDRYDDPDGDGADNLEELLQGQSPAVVDNDMDGDDLPDNWERRFFGSTTLTQGGDDPDQDGLSNLTELNMGIHPGRTAVDRDLDDLPDLWESRLLDGLGMGPSDLFPGSCLTNLEAYRRGFGSGCVFLDPSTVDMDGDGICDEEDPCVGTDDLTLTAQTVTGSQLYQACVSITAGDGFHIGAPGDVTFLAGSRVSLTSGFSVGPGAQLRVEIDPALALN